MLDRLDRASCGSQSVQTVSWNFALNRSLLGQIIIDRIWNFR